MSWAEIPVFLLVGFAVMHLVIGLHEVGHLVAGRVVGIEIVSFHIGSGPPTLRFRCGRMPIRWGLCPSYGFVRAAPSQRLSAPWSASVYILGGITAELVLVMCGYLVWRDRSTWTELWELPLFRYGFSVGGLYLAWSMVFGLSPKMCWVGGEMLPNDTLQFLNLWRNRKARIAKRPYLHDVAAYNELARSGDVGSADAFLAELLRRYPNEIDLRFASARLKAARRDPVGARNEMERLLAELPEKSPQRTQILDVLISMVLAEGRAEWLADADRWSFEALKLEPHSITLLGSRGSVLAELGRNQESRLLLAEVLDRTESDTDRVYSSTWRGSMHRMGGIPKLLLGCRPRRIMV